jgi:hypothetical protein
MFLGIRIQVYAISGEIEAQLARKGSFMPEIKKEL